MELEQLKKYLVEEAKRATEHADHDAIMERKATYRIDKRFFKEQKAFWEGYLDAIVNVVLFLKEPDAE